MLSWILTGVTLILAVPHSLLSDLVILSDLSLLLLSSLLSPCINFCFICSLVS
ncbi:hypothetical protein BCR41DRAFT_363728 [Lobosporangium transversale]|uniref:Uncharacterized protein n=1 Tax=Lobosporangium transversale TaxID=64571 RepID=A0A1Y2G8Q1_9FUNG|nr:hypothetical protein BCR41DRAFT_363728 [Lobosporangium transversale]ORY99783.1 hypothetical protein BCR41DRAFT_363728 [Lobosporangium transversale]|eukprot:XP_021876017.1 hypothetical protein BCR41DRAFT_363728 [Lobosporangium transversale]